MKLLNQNVFEFLVLPEHKPMMKSVTNDFNVREKRMHDALKCTSQYKGRSKVIVISIFIKNKTEGYIKSSNYIIETK